MREVVLKTMTAGRLLAFAELVALAGLLAACSSSAERFETLAKPARSAAVNDDVVYSAPISVKGKADGPERLSDSSIPGVCSGCGKNAGGANSVGHQPYSGTGSVGNGRSVIVGMGQTLYAVARQNGVRTEDVIKANGLLPPYHLKAGQRLWIPLSTHRSAMPAQSARTLAPPASSAQSSVGSRAHIVCPGETLYSLGRSYGLPPSEIAAFNGFEKSRHLRIGETVLIPMRHSDPNSNLPTSVTDRQQGTRVKTVSSMPIAGGASNQPETTAVTGQIAASGVATASGATATTATPPGSHHTSSQTPALTRGSISNFRWPAKGRIISRYGPKDDGSSNDGINIAVPVGTKVHAAEKGVVVYAGNELKGYGNLVLIRHLDNWVTAYAHNDKLLVSQGDKVRRGDIIAKAGRSGSVTSPQIHFEIRKGSQTVDPLDYLADSGLSAN
ncbi:MAG: LysM peptidoglycan-binding domain-containing M23 family metallopeptidase [Hyphomicrobiales bacterium]